MNNAQFYVLVFTLTIPAAYLLTRVVGAAWYQAKLRYQQQILDNLKGD